MKIKNERQIGNSFGVVLSLIVISVSVFINNIPLAILGAAGVYMYAKYGEIWLNW